MEPLPCPFCGKIGVSLVDGSTFRWRRLACDHCDAQTGEERISTTGEQTQFEREKNVAERLIVEWNKRAK